MRLKSIFITTLSKLRFALKLAPVAVMLAVVAEAAQHIVEYKLGMYESYDAFVLYQADPLRLTFGYTKAASLVIATYFITKGLTDNFGPKSISGSFLKHFFRKMWDPRGQATGIFALFVMCAPVIAIHYGLSYTAMGNSMAPVLLALDSILVGLIALILGTTMWASDAAGSIVST